MPHLTRRTFVGGAAAGIAATGLAGSAAILAQDDLPELTVGSQNFTEQFILAEMCALLLENTGYPVQTEHNLGGTLVIHEARNAGDIDLHVIYLGDGVIILGHDITDIREPDMTNEELVEATYDFVKAGYQEGFNAVLLEPVGINNSYALAMRREHAEELGVTTISDLEEFAPDLAVGGSQEFIIRPDGLPGMEEAYGFSFGSSQGMESGLMYQALENEDVDVISAFATDGRIVALDFVLLEDDLGFFPPSHGVPVVRGEVLEANPEVTDIINKLGGLLDNETMAELNLRVDEGGEEPRPVAEDFLTQQGLLGGE